MEPKRFLTAGEVFQVFGVGAEALDELVASGDVKQLADMGTFKYRSEDFVALVRSGKLTPRTAGEMFQLDDKGDIPFLKVKNDDEEPLKFDDEVSMFELDEEALAEQASHEAPAVRTPKIAENWFDDSDEAIDLPKTSDTSGEIHIVPAKVKRGDEKTDFDQNTPVAKLTSDSESDVKIFDENIDFDEPDVHSSISDSDVRLSGPVSASGSLPTEQRTRMPGSDSDVRLARPVKSAIDSDSDVVIVPPLGSESTSSASLAQPLTKRPETDSGIRLESPVMPRREGPESDSDVILVGVPVDTGRQITSSPAAAKKSDSDVVLVGLAIDEGGQIAGKPETAKRADSDSDVRLADLLPEDQSGEHAPPMPVSIDVNQSALDETDSSIRLVRGDSSVSLDDDQAASKSSSESSIHDSGIFQDVWEAASAIKLESVAPEVSPEVEVSEDPAIVDDGKTVEIEAFDGGVSMDSSESENGISLDEIDAETESAHQPGFGDDSQTVEIESFHDGISLDLSNEDSGITLEPAPSERGFVEEPVPSDSGILLAPEVVDHGMSLGMPDADSGIRFDFGTPANETAEEAVKADSGISFAPEDADSGIALDAEEVDSGIAMAPSSSESGLALDFLGGDSGITLDFGKSDGENSLNQIEDSDSGISLGLADADSGIMLEDVDSGIRIDQSGDSGISIDATGDSGISIDDADFQTSGTISEGDDLDFGLAGHGHDPRDGVTQTIDVSREHVQDSAFDLNLADGDATSELNLEDIDPEATFVPTGRGKKGAKQQSPGLSEAFTLDEPLEVEDLDISEDLDAAGLGELSGEFSDEFAEAEEEVLEASDADFGGEQDEASIAEEDEFGESEDALPVAKTRAQPKEPAWGMLTVIPIICASVFMAVTATILWGGIATMWTGGEAPGPAGTLISTLAGLF